MYVYRKRLLYSSFIIVMALLLSAGLLQMTQTTAQSAGLSAPANIANNGIEYPLVITKTVEGGAADSEWQFTVESSTYFTSVTIPAAGGSTTVTLPFSGYYTVTEVMQDGYSITNASCSQPIQAQVNGYLYSNSIPYVFIGELPVVGCEFVNGKDATLTVVKEAIPESSQPFSMAVNSSFAYDSVVPINQEVAVDAAAVYEEFQLVDDGSDISNTKTFTGLVAGEVAGVGEYPAEGWIPEKVACVDSNGDPTPPPDIKLPDFRPADIGFASAADLVKRPMPPTFGASFMVKPGENYTCTFTNLGPSLTVTKTVGTDPATCATEGAIDVFSGTEVYFCYEVENTGGVTLTTHSLTDDVLGDLLTDFAYDLFPGASVDSVTAGLVVTSAPTVDVTNVATWTGVYTQEVLQGEAVEVITLTAEAEAVAQVDVYEPSRLIIDKVTDPAGSDVEFAFEWGELEGTPEGFSLSDTDEPFVTPDLFPGSYAVSEEVPADWNLVDVTCQDATGATYLPNAIELGEGVEVTCTFTNEEDIPTGLDETPMPNMDIEQFLPWMGATE